MFLPNWSYDGPDPGLRLFTLANPKLPAVGDDAEVFEIGSADTDWLARVDGCSAHVVRGIDWRKTGRLDVIRGDVMTANLPIGLDAVVSLSTIEHVGLGHYENDPVDVYGDIKTVQRVRDHLNAGGFFYFDVPYAPEGYFVKGTKCRVYDDQALQERFGPHEVLGYTLPSVNGWIEKPTRNCDGPKPYYYVALLVRKAGAEN